MRTNARLISGQQVGPWRVERALGSGAVATVYQVRHRDLHSLAALKVLHVDSEEDRERLLREGQMQASLRHPNIVAVHDVVWIEGCLALVLEYVDGADLRRRLAVGPPFDLARIDLVARGLLSGVGEAHRAGWVHRDLKPANVLLSGSADRPIPKISDFGVAKVLGPRDPAGLTGSALVGSPAYMAPEQFRLASGVDHRADIHALACVLYELVTGRPAYAGASLEEVRRKIEAGDRAPILRFAPDTPARMSRAIEAGLTGDPDGRPGSCEQMAELWESGAMSSATPPAPMRSSAPPAPLAERTALVRLGTGSEPGETFACSSLAEAVAFVEECREALPGATAARFHAAIHVGRGGDATVITERIRALAAPDRILVSAPEGVSVGDAVGHGTWRIGVLEPLQLFERSGGQPVRTLADRARTWRAVRGPTGWEPVRPVPGTLPPGEPRSVGRDAELAMLDRAHDGETRLAVVEGPDGAGKTTLAVAYARITRGSWAGAWLCDLAGGITAGDLALAVCSALGLGLETEDRSDPCVRLGDALGWRGRCLLLLDAADTLDRDALRVIWQWLDRAPELHVVLTARQAPELPGACRIALPALPAPLAVDLAGRWEAASERERSTLAQCTVFVAGFRPDAAERVVAPADGLTGATLQKLVDRRLLHRAGERFLIHDSVGAWVRARCEAFEDGRDVLSQAEARHASHFARERTVTVGRGPRLDDVRNIAVACRRAIRAGDAPTAVATCLRLSALLGDTGPVVALVEEVTAVPGLTRSNLGDLCGVLARGRSAIAGLAHAERDTARMRLRTDDRDTLRRAEARLATEQAFARVSVVQLGRALALLEPEGNHLAAATLVLQRGDLHRLSMRSDAARSDYLRAAALLRACGAHDALGGVTRRLAGLHLDHGELEQARIGFLEALGAASRAADRGEMARVRCDLGALELLCRRHEAALACFRSALATRRELGDRSGEAEALLLVAGAERELGRVRDAIHDAGAALSLYRELGASAGVRRAEQELAGLTGPNPGPSERSGTSESAPAGSPIPSAGVGADLLRQGFGHRERGRNGWALGCFTSARWTFSKAGDRANAGLALREIGSIHRTRGHLEPAAQSYQAALAILRSAGRSRNVQVEGEVRRVLAELYEQRDDAVEGRERLEQALAGHRAAGRKADEGITLGALAVHLHRHGDTDRALRCCEGAIAVHRALGRRGSEAIDIGTLANIRSARGEVEEAEALYREAIGIHLEVGNGSAAGGVSSNLAWLLHQEERLEDASEVYLEAIPLLRASGRTDRLVQALGNLGDARRAQGELTDAGRWFDEAVALRTNVPDVRIEATLLGQRAALAAARRDPREAEELFTIAGRLLCERPDPARLAGVLLARAEFEARRGDRELSLALLDEVRILLPAPPRPVLARMGRMRASGRS